MCFLGGLMVGPRLVEHNTGWVLGEFRCGLFGFSASQDKLA